MLTKLGPYLFRAGVPSTDFEYIAAPQYTGRQRQTMWCWAASIQMVLNYHGLFVTQEQVVQRVFGLQYNYPANPNQILYALSGWAPDTRGRLSEIYAEYYSFTPFQLVTDLSNNWPLLVGSRINPIGHTCVLTAVEYLQFITGVPILTKAIFRDPWPGNFSKQESAWVYFSLSTAFFIRIWVSRL
jgi:hypothetical protein